MTVTFLARELKTPLIGQTFLALGDQAGTDGWSHEEYLVAVLGRQVASRAVNGGTRMRISAARFPQLNAVAGWVRWRSPVMRRYGSPAVRSGRVAAAAVRGPTLSGAVRWAC